jgi:hypothetical protein
MRYKPCVTKRYNRYTTPSRMPMRYSARPYIDTGAVTHPCNASNGKRYKAFQAARGAR